MDLQNVFYLLASVFMGLLVIILILSIIVITTILLFLRKAQKNITQTIQDVKNRTQKAEFAKDVGSAIAGTIISRAKDAFRKKT